MVDPISKEVADQVLRKMPGPIKRALLPELQALSVKLDLLSEQLRSLEKTTDEGLRGVKESITIQSESLDRAVNSLSKNVEIAVEFSGMVPKLAKEVAELREAMRDWRGGPAPAKSGFSPRSP